MTLKRVHSILHVFILLQTSVLCQIERFATDCMTPNNAIGVCVELQTCKKLFDQVLNDNKDVYPFIRASRCDPHTDTTLPKVCCGPDINFTNSSDGDEQSCTTPNGDIARCIHLKSCQLFYDYVQQPFRDPEINKFLAQSKCGKAADGFPLVCCGNVKTFRTQSTLPNRSECGYQDNFRVVGGENTDLTEFPWTALLQKTRASGQKSWDCGGTLINDRYVLTAAHCVTSPVTLVRLGEWNLDTTEDCVGEGTYRTCSLPPQDIQVEKTIPHPQYTRNSQGIFNDIALLRLATPATITKYVSPICLPLPHERSSIGQRSYVTGWGAVSTRQSSSSKKQKLKIPIVDLQVCETQYSTRGAKVNEKMVCAGGEKGKDSCKGDSGGPLISKPSPNSVQYYIEGIVSYGHIECGKEGFPAIYTRVSDFLDWIQDNVKP